MKSIRIAAVIINLLLAAEAQDRTRGYRKKLLFKQNGLRRSRFSEEAEADGKILGGQEKRVLHGKSCKTYDVYDKKKKTCAPSTAPSEMPSQSPSLSMEPSSTPTTTPSVSPSMSPQPSASPSALPSASPSVSPSVSPSESPSASPSGSPSASPSANPTSMPSLSLKPSLSPSSSPTAEPSQIPSNAPTVTISASPSKATVNVQVFSDSNNQETGRISTCVENPPADDDEVKVIKFEYVMSLVESADSNSVVSEVERDLHEAVVSEFLSCDPVDDAERRQRQLLEGVARNLQQLTSNKISSEPTDSATKTDCPTDLDLPNSKCVIVSGALTVTSSSEIDNDKLVEKLTPVLSSQLGKKADSSDEINGIKFLGIKEIEGDDGITYTPSGAEQDAGNGDSGVNAAVVAPVVIFAVGLLILISLFAMKRKPSTKSAYAYDSNGDLENYSDTSNSLEDRGTANILFNESGSRGEVEVDDRGGYFGSIYDQPSSKDVMWDSSRHSKNSTPRTETSETSVYSPSELKTMLDDLSPTRSSLSARKYDAPDTVIL
mmetsp:Transcript_16671/g.23494  ORF Transcript_16671/g.23494 Transcript_16671/m.23494 type:complete len:547 (+) Transcript_16671:99-1739(+)